MRDEASPGQMPVAVGVTPPPDLALKPVLDALPDALVITDLSGSVTFLNAEAERLTGWGTGSGIGEPVARVVLAREASSADPTPLPLGGTHWLTPRNGTPLAIAKTSDPLLDEEGGLGGMILLFREVSTEEHPDTSVGEGDYFAPFADALSGVSDPLLMVSPDGLVLSANGAATEFFGISTVPSDGAPLRVLSTEIGFGNLAARLAGDSAVAETTAFEIVHPVDGRCLSVRTYPSGENRLVLLSDISEQKKAQAEESKREKLEALGFLARGFAHEFNNLLTVIIGNVSLATMHQKNAGATTEELEEARRATLEAQNLIHQLLTFAKGGAPIRKSTDLGQVVAKALSGRRRKRGIYYTNAIAEGLPEIDIDAGQVRRLIANLIRNAEDACGTSGTITITCRIDHNEGARPAALVEVSDNGGGIPSDVRERVFEPFFTTRQSANASGIGLTVCRSIARSHGGSLELVDNTDGGTTARLRLPLPSDFTLPQAGARAGGAPAREQEPSRGRILILEDEPFVRRLAATNLRTHGFFVEETEDGADTIRRYRESSEAGTTFDVVILDLTIPDGVGGTEAAREIRSFDPDAKTVVSSGYSDDPAMAQPEAYGFSAVLPKPYEPDDLVTLVEKLVSDAPGRPALSGTPHPPR